MKPTPTEELEKQVARESKEETCQMALCDRRTKDNNATHILTEQLPVQETMRTRVKARNFTM